jgi:NAD(P)-dependent dehydrogenase (short-subunit alcohol dehydrogenase family)
MAAQPKAQSMRAMSRQSPPLEFPYKVDDSWVKFKTILITGGASGFGLGFVRRWAKAGAIIIFGDYNVVKGQQAERDVRAETGNQQVYFIKCDVTKWQDQVDMFHEAVKLSPHGGIDCVVANAGIADTKVEFEHPQGLDAQSPPLPDLSCLNVNLTGVVYTAHLAMYYLQKNPGSSAANPDCNPSEVHRDRHLMLLGSVASFLPIPGQSLYGATKHAVLGLWRSLRTTVFEHGVRTSILMPYFIDTPLLPTTLRVVMAGSKFGTVDDVVEAGTRFVSDPRIVGRAVFVGPRFRVAHDQQAGWALTEGREVGEERAIWEMYPDDLEDTEIFGKNMVKILNRAVEMRGWVGWGADTVAALGYGVKAWWRS